MWRKGLIAFLFGLPVMATAQCAMCRKNAEAAAPGLALGLRVGIVVLFVAPYIAAGVVGWLWYKRMRSSERLGPSNRDGGAELPSRSA
ncbi:MAG: hypothetical protein N2170_06455 [Bacteroidia bacterium]|nr:hypothetical protein [Bacteroidia bacterium]